MKIIFRFFLLILIVVTFSNAYSQENAESERESGPTDTQLIILFSVAIIFVIAIGIYISRELIFRKKFDYDKADLESKKDRDFEKYHSDWQSEEIISESKKTKKDEEFLKDPIDGKLPNYYEVLGVSEKATQNDIKKRYRKLAIELHPDKSKGKNTQDKMSEVNKAYEILSDKEKREKYDQVLNIS